MARLSSKREINLMIFLSVSVYFFSYLTRINYTAIIVELLDKKIATKPQAATVTTIAFITYGAGQLLSGFIGDRFSPRRLIFAGYLVTVAMNFLMPISSYNFLLMAVVWGINGLAQAFMWPPLIRIMCSALPGTEYFKAVPLIGIGSSAATIAVYIFAPVIILYLDWKYVFYIFALITFIAAILWNIITGKLLRNVKKDDAIDKLTIKTSYESDSGIANSLIQFLPMLIILIAVQGILRDGITTWTPSFMSENFKIEASKSIFSVVGAPLFHIVSNILTYRILKYLNNNIFKVLSIYFLISVALLLSLRIFAMDKAWVSWFLISLTTGVVSGINLLQTGYIPKYFMGKGCVSIFSGVINFSTYIGSAASTYLFAVISDSFGWNATVESWIGFAIVGFLLNTIMWRLIICCAVKKFEFTKK